MCRINIYVHVINIFSKQHASITVILTSLIKKHNFLVKEENDDDEDDDDTKSDIDLKLKDMVRSM